PGPRLLPNHDESGAVGSGIGRQSNEVDPARDAAAVLKLAVPGRRVPTAVCAAVEEDRHAATSEVEDFDPDRLRIRQAEPDDRPHGHRIRDGRTQHDAAGNTLRDLARSDDGHLDRSVEQSLVDAVSLAVLGITRSDVDRDGPGCRTYDPERQVDDRAVPGCE